jgi:hypothetical protein
MSHKSILNCPRIFTDPGSDYQVSTTLEVAISDTTDTNITITVADTVNFKSSGFITINTEQFYYSAKTKTTFTGVTRNVNNLPSFQSHIIGSTVYQSFEAPNKLNTTDPELAGWYVDGYSNQASLRVREAPVIQPGVIRYVEDPDDPTQSKFQGCISFDNSGPTWQDFNATQGPTGESGGVQTVLEFEHISNNPLTDNITNSGEIVKTTTLDTVDETTIQFRKITEGTRTINFENQTTVEIETNNNSVIINPKQMPFTQDLTQDTDTLKGEDSNKCYGETQRLYVALGTTVNKGQAVRYTKSTLANNTTYITVEPFTFDNSNVEYLTKFNAENINVAIAGIALETITSASDTVLASLEPVLICTRGVCQVKITDNFGVTAFDHTTPQVNYMGRPCILNTDGFGFNTAEQVAPNTNYVELGTFMEIGNTVAAQNAFVLINFNPVWYEEL